MADTGTQIPLTYTDEDVAGIFAPERYNIQSIRLLNEGDRPQHRAVGTRFRGAGFVRLANRSEAEAAVAELNGKLLPGHQKLRNGHFETLQVRFADTEAQKLVKASAKVEPKQLLLEYNDQPSTPKKAERKAIEAFYPLTPTKAATPTAITSPSPPTDHYLRHLASPSNASTTSISTSASSSPVFSILSSNHIHQAPWAIPTSSAASSPITPFDSPVQQKVASSYSFPSAASGSLAHQMNNSGGFTQPSMFPPVQPSGLPGHQHFSVTQQQAPMSFPTAPMSTMPSLAGLPPMQLPDHLQALANVPSLPLAAANTGDPALASLLAAAFQQGQISARMQALSADIVQQQQSLDMQLSPSNGRMGMQPSQGQALASPQQAMLHDQQRDWPPHLQQPSFPSHARDVALAATLADRPAFRDTLQSNESQQYYSSNLASENDTHRFATGYGQDKPSRRAALQGLGISGLHTHDVPPDHPVWPSQTMPMRPRADTDALSHPNEPDSVPGLATGLLAPESALARRSSAIESRFMRNEGTGEVMQSQHFAAAEVPARMQSRPSVTFFDAPPPGLGEPSANSTSSSRPRVAEKIVLPYSKTLRSFSAFGLETPPQQHSLGDSGYGGPSAYRTAEREEEEERQAGGKYVIPSRRSSHIGFVSPPASGASKPGLGRAISRPNLHKTLRESFSNMSLRNGSTQEMQEEPEGSGSDYEEADSLTQISPTYTFGTSYASSNQVSPPQRMGFKKQPSASVANLAVPSGLPESYDRKGSDASSGSQDVTDQYAKEVLQPATSVERAGRELLLTDSERFLRSLLGRKGSLPIGL